MKTKQMVLTLVGLAVLALSGCNTKVPENTIGRIKGPSGWKKDIYQPGHHACYGRDQMFLADTTQQTHKVPMSILVGGKVNLSVTVEVRCALSKDADRSREVYENATIGEGRRITHETLYNTYLSMIVSSVPRNVIGEKADIQSVVDNRQTIESSVATGITDESKATPMEILDVRITNYDWPESVTKAQERLAAIELKEAEQAAQTRADLQKAEGDLQVEEARKLVEMKKAESIAEGIKIVREELQECPEYLQWHTVRVMGEAANGPNNAFILFPYNMPGMTEQMDGMRQTALFDQVLKSNNGEGGNAPRPKSTQPVEVEARPLPMNVPAPVQK